MHGFRKHEPSSPMRKAIRRRTSTRRRRLLLSSVICSLIWCMWFLLRSADISTTLPETQNSSVQPHSETAEQLHPNSLPYVPSNFSNSHGLFHETIGAIIPVTTDSISHLEPMLLQLLNNSMQIGQVSLVCSAEVLQKTRSTLRVILSSPKHVDHIEFSLLTWARGTTEAAAMLQATSQTTTDKIFFLTERGIDGIRHNTRNAFLSGSFSLPFGPHGSDATNQSICLDPLDAPRTASFLTPPFLAPSSILHKIERLQDLYTWAAFGDAVAGWSGNDVGGITIQAEEEITEACANLSPKANPTGSIISQENLIEDKIDTLILKNPEPSLGVVALLFRNSEDIRAFSKAACRLQNDGNQVYAILYEQASQRVTQNTSYFSLDDCALQYHTHRHTNSLKSVKSWLERVAARPDILVSLEEDHSIAQTISSELASQHQTTVIRIPGSDLHFCDWMGSLTLLELKHWHSPQVDFTIITNDRPHSLRRLLSSLHNARYFGDRVNLRINLEQDADLETLRMVERLRWSHGAIFVGHRVIHGGLLPAVVESWYPHSNDSYGLILEDDVELSPLFYAWVKMTLLRYRYGEKHNKSPNLYGISLYQQKNIEMKPEGRQLFNARTIFAAENWVTGYNTPYLSQIPCSWGAVYFPEHWREFHTYLGVRLSELALGIDEVVVPDIRSNKWTKSWKKYFIELVHLRGYVMLYPNYEHFLSLSTNHLEVGSHVKDIPKEAYMQKKELFSVPLIPEEGASTLLELPGRRLPEYTYLPTLNLFGDMTSTTSLVSQGLSRRNAVFPSCPTPDTLIPFDVHDLFCLISS